MVGFHQRVRAGARWAFGERGAKAHTPSALRAPPSETKPSQRRITFFSTRSHDPFCKGPARPLPFLLWRVSAGFPSPAADFVEEALDLNDLIVKNPPATFMMRVAGQSMEPAGIYDGDLLVVDRSLEVRPGSIVITYLNGELTVKHVERHGRRLALVSANCAFPAVEVTEEMDFAVWGVVTHVIRSIR